MSDLRRRLAVEFQDEEYRYAYAESFVNARLAAQIKILREQRGMTQAQVAAMMGTKQSGFARFEDVNHSTWKTDTLWKIAEALGVRLSIGFETFSSLIDEQERFSRESLELPRFEDDMRADGGPQKTVSHVDRTGERTFGLQPALGMSRKEPAADLTRQLAEVIPIAPGVTPADVEFKPERGKKYA